MKSPVSYTIDDKDLDDAALWAVIDSAEASHSPSASRKQLTTVKQRSFHSPISKRSPPPPSKNPQSSKCNSNAVSPYSDPYRSRPQKMARTCASEASEGTSPLAVVRTPIATTMAYSSPEAYLSPQIGRYVVNDFDDDRSDVSPGSYVRQQHGDQKDLVRHCLNLKFPSVSLFKDYQNAAMAILEKSDYMTISGHPFIKKSGWRKISCFFNLSFEIKDKSIEFDENRNVQRAEFIVRAHMHGGRFSDGWGSCEKREKRFFKPNHDIPSTAETRAKNKACQDLLGIGEYRPGAGQSHQQQT
ncbi:unnamed protein product [Linum tenue]|uniref:Uncharacterized protein n=1 Tax=Linum tenue TaxID=586396 RepID=A0AAV0PRA3_9ROSI|nr:unnamed protein product [Linum tenue]